MPMFIGACCAGRFEGGLGLLERLRPLAKRSKKVRLIPSPSRAPQLGAAAEYVAAAPSNPAHTPLCNAMFIARNAAPGRLEDPSSRSSGQVSQGTPPVAASPRRLDSIAT